LTELGELIQFDDSDRWLPREDRVREVRKGDVTIFKSVGVGIQDVAIVRAVVDHAKARGIGTVIRGYN
jgi:ornithine cyclodeaminase/alanine dehydrogenase-like protein (mu-crystallin family)